MATSGLGAGLTSGGGSSTGSIFGSGFSFDGFLDALDRPLGRGVRHHLLGSGGDIRLPVGWSDRQRCKFDHNGSGGLGRLGRLAPGDHRGGAGAMCEHHDRSADHPAPKLGNILGRKRDHGAGTFSSPTSATLR